MRTTTIVGQLDLSDSLGTMLDFLQDETVEGALGDFIYTWKNGQQILIGSRQPETLPEELVVETTAFVFMSKDDGRQHRRPTTWNDLRASLAEGWVVGTERKPGVKAWYPKTGRSIRRQMQDIYVFREPRTVAGGDSIHIGLISNNTGAVAVGRGARATVINQVVRGLGYLQTRHEASVRNFLDYYVGSSDFPEPFGGREPDLAAYTRWLDDPAAPPYALLTAPAGMGKSAVLAHWVLRIEQRRDVAVVFFPISERFETNSKNVVFSALFARLAFLHGDPPTRLFSAEEYRGAFQDYLTRPLPDGRRLLMVLDGLDEASGWEVGAGIFPPRAPSHLKVMVAAREIAGDLDWATRLGWRVPTEAVSLGLRGLSKVDLEEVLLRMGDPLAGLRANFDLVDKLYELTDHGDPLMIRLYVDALSKDQDSVSDFQPENLQRLKPGLGRFFEFWFAQQENLWRASGDLIDRKAVDTLVHARAMSYGPLTADDLDALNHDTFHGTSGVRRVANALRRFLVGTGARGRGYSFSHPRLTQHFREQLSDSEREDWENRYLAYGAATLAALKEGGLKPQDAPEYVVRHYRLHLEARAGSPDVLSALIVQGWLQAWLALEGTEEGYLSDVQAAMECAAKSGPIWLGQVIRGALCFSSVRSLGTSIDASLLSLAVSMGVLNGRVGLFIARNKQDPYDRSKALLRILRVLSSSERDILQREALAAAREIGDMRLRADALSAVAEQVSAYEALDVLSEALAAAHEVEDEGLRTRALVAVVERLPADGIGQVLGEALVAVRRVSGNAQRAEALIAVARRLTGNEAQKIILEALTAARGIEGYERRTETLITVANELPVDSAKEVLGEVLAVAHELGDAWGHAQALIAMAKRLPRDEVQEALSEALVSALGIADASKRARTLVAVADWLPPSETQEVLSKALAAARAINEDWLRALSLGMVATHLPADEAQMVLREELVVAERIGADGQYTQALVDLAERLPSNSVRQVLAEIRGPIYSPSAIQILNVVVPRLPPAEAWEVLSEALTAARVIGDEYHRVQALVAVAERLRADVSQVVLRNALTVARGIEQKLDRAIALGAVAKGLLAGEAQKVVDEALATARDIGDPWDRVQALVAVADLLADLLSVDEAQRIFSEALVAARAIEVQWQRAVALGAVAERLSTDAAQVVLGEALREACNSLVDEGHRGLALCHISKRFAVASLELLLVALAAARTLKYPTDRAVTLLAVAALLPADGARESVLGEALTAAREIEDEKLRAETLSAIAERLTDAPAQEVLSEALAAARRVTDGMKRTTALIAVARRLPDDQAQEVLREAYLTARKLRDSEYLAISAGQAKERARWAASARLGESDLLIQMLCPPPRVTRDNLLSVLVKYAPVLHEVSGDKALLELFSAICDTAEWWP